MPSPLGNNEKRMVGSMGNKSDKPVQIQIDIEKWRILQVYAATQGKTGNQLVKELAEKKADRVSEKVAALL